MKKKDTDWLFHGKETETLGVAAAVGGNPVDKVGQVLIILIAEAYLLYIHVFVVTAALQCGEELVEIGNSLLSVLVHGHDTDAVDRLPAVDVEEIGDGVDGDALRVFGQGLIEEGIVAGNLLATVAAGILGIETGESGRDAVRAHSAVDGELLGGLVGSVGLRLVLRDVVFQKEKGFDAFAVEIMFPYDLLSFRPFGYGGKDGVACNKSLVTSRGGLAFRSKDVERAVLTGLCRFGNGKTDTAMALLIVTDPLAQNGTHEARRVDIIGGGIVGGGVVVGPTVVVSPSGNGS